MKKYIFLWLLNILFYGEGQSQSLQWAARMGGVTSDPNTSPDDLVYDIKVDNDGNVYSCGRIGDIADFNGTAVQTHGMYDLFVSKHNCAGQLVWAKTAGSFYFNENAVAMVLDNNGNLYITGTVRASIIHPVTFWDTTFTNDKVSMYLAKLDTNGNLIWAKFDGVDSVYISATSANLKIDTSGFLHLSFGTSGAGELYPGTSVTRGPYLAKFDTSGTLLSLFNFSDNYTIGAYDFTVDNQGNYIMTGSWDSDTVHLGNQVLINPKPGSDIFYTAKFDSIGNFQWVYMFDDTLTVLTGSNGYGVITDNADNIYIAGAAYPGLKCGNHVLANLPGFNSELSFILKLTPAGQPIWVSQGYHQAPSVNEGAIAMKSNGNILFTSNTLGLGIFGNDTIYQTGFGTRDIFVAEADTSGNWINAFNIPSNGSKDYSYCITTDSLDNIYIGGAYNLSLTINGVTHFSAGGETDGFIAKYGSVCVTGIEEEVAAGMGINIYPNPASGVVNINCQTGITSITIVSISGQEVKQESFSNQKEVQITISNLNPGIYITRVQTKERIVNGKLVVN